MNRRGFQRTLMKRRSLHKGLRGVYLRVCVVWALREGLCMLWLVGPVCAVVCRGCVCCGLHAPSTQGAQPEDSRHTALSTQPPTVHTQHTADAQPTERTALGSANTRPPHTADTQRAAHTQPSEHTHSPQRTQPYPLHAHPTGPIATVGLSWREAFTKAAGCPSEEEKPS
jgi:hypothetical protein